MPNDPNPSDPKSRKIKPAASPAPEDREQREVFDLSDVEFVDPFERDIPPVEAEAVEVPPLAHEEAVPSIDSVSFDIPAGVDEPESLTAGIRLEDFPELAAHLRESTGLSDVIPSAEPASATHNAPLADPASSDRIPFAESTSGSSVSLMPEAIPGSSVIIATSFDRSEPLGNFEPVTPVAPASGWLDEDDVPAAAARGEPLEEPLGVHPADLFDAAPPIESSDIFASGPIPMAAGTEHSDVIAATAYGAITPNPSVKPAHPSDVAITFDQPPGGSTIGDAAAAGDLPVAEEVPDEFASELEESPVLPHPPSVHDSVTDYGSTPIATPDASSILADLSDPGEITIEESSAVRLEAPGVASTHTSDEGTEFDLTISDDPVHPDLAAADAAFDDEATDWQQQSDSNLFANPNTTSAEINLDDEGVVAPINPNLRSDDPSLTSAPSSIFTGGKPPGPSGSKSGTGGPSSDSVRIGRPPEEEDAAVEFSDHPEAEPESSSAVLLGPKGRPRPAGKVDFNESAKAKLSPAKPVDDDPDSGRVDWSAAALADSDEATVGFPQDLIGASPEEILKHLQKKSKESKPDDDRTRVERERPAKKGGGKGKPVGKDESDPSVEIDWMAGSSSEEPAIAPDVYGTAAPKKEKGKGKDKKKDEAKRPEPRRESKEGARQGKGGWVGGTVLGMVIAGSASAGLYFAGVIPNVQPGATSQNKTNLKGQTDPTSGSAVTVADAHDAINAGEPAKALKLLDTVNASAPDKVTAETKAAIGQARLFAAVQELGKSQANPADNADLKKAREELQAVVDDREAVSTPDGEKAAVKAAIHLGLSYELAGDWKQAKKVYEDGVAKFSDKYKSTFQAALDRLAATAPAGESTSQRRLTPADVEKFLFTIVLIQVDAPAKEDDEAGAFFWKAVKLASTGKYGDAVDEIAKAKAAHIKRAKALAGRGLNPLTDPLEQIFPRCCDDLTAYWNLRAAIYENKTVSELIQKEGAKEAMKTLAVAQTKALESVKLMADLKESGNKLKDTIDKLAKSQKDLKDATEKFDARTKVHLENEAKARDENIKVVDERVAAERNLKKANDFIASLAKELQTAKLLSEKYDNDALLAAQKTAVERASGPTLTGLVPPGMMGVAGAPLTSAQLVDVAGRLTKSEAVAKAATEKLASETKRLTTEHVAELKRLKDGNDAAVKKMMEDFAVKTTDLKEKQVLELKVMAEKCAVDLKKQTDENTAAVKKLTEGYEGKIKDLQTAVAKEKVLGEAVAAGLRTEIKNSVTPAQALDLWLPQLTELRRVSDCDPALANANKVLASAAADSEDAAKARTVAGLALLLKGDLVEAKNMFQLARSSPAYKAAVGKEWVHVADIGIDSITDPLAPYRLPVEKPRRDVKLAARYLDDGIRAYKELRYADAASALIESTKADPTDPLAWYYLGAARWATGAREQAKKDYLQGSEWEKLSPRTARAISDDLALIQGPARDALTAARP